MMPVHIAYQVTRDLDEEAVAGDVSCLSAEERTRGSRYAIADDRRDFLAAHVMLRRSLSALQPRDPASWIFVGSPTGKPRLDECHGREGPGFNLSHTRGLVACIVARGGDVGIDVERVSAFPDLLDVARDRFSREEVVELERCEPAERACRFTETWTLKEAYVKATGAGLSAGVDVTFSVTPGGTRPLVRADMGGAGRAESWHFLLLELAGYRLAAAVRAPGEVITFVVDEPAGLGGRRTRPRLLGMSSSVDLLYVPGVG